MPFRSRIFQQSIAGRVSGSVEEALTQACETYETVTAHSVKKIMDELDQTVDAPTRRAIMVACGRQCIGASILDKARRLAKTAPDLDALLALLNQKHIGGGHLQREGDVIHAAYDRCYCGSVNKTKEPFSDTYCYCSCGWYHGLFETILGKPVEVELLGSIIQGDEKCRFLIRLPADLDYSQKETQS